jgi:hypothetical protein
VDRRAIECFDQALVDAGLARDESVRRALHDYFAWQPPSPAHSTIVVAGPVSGWTDEGS